MCYNEIMIDRIPSDSGTEEAHSSEWIVENYFRKRLEHSLSKDLPENELIRRYEQERASEKKQKQGCPRELTPLESFTASLDTPASIGNLYTPYKNALGEYSSRRAGVSERIQAARIIHSDEPKTAFLKEDDPNIGWKFHLNVVPSSVKQVSDYLIEQGYEHKYLNGGEAEDGKVFTVYIGDYSLAQKLALKLSQDLQGLLSKPEVETEIELASGVVGRFVGPNIDFYSYGTSGFSLLSRYFNQFHFEQNPERKSVLQREAEIESFKRLKEMYGKYFFSED